MIVLFEFGLVSWGCAGTPVCFVLFWFGFSGVCWDTSLFYFGLVSWGGWRGGAGTPVSLATEVQVCMPYNGFSFLPFFSFFVDGLTVY